MTGAPYATRRPRDLQGLSTRWNMRDSTSDWSLANNLRTRSLAMPNAFAHIELNTDDLSKAKKFYKKVFAWKLNDMKMGGPPYTMIDVGGKGTGGGMQKKHDGGMPTAWLPYVEVDDVKKTIAKASKAGAKVMVDFMPVGEMGAIGIFMDPTGAMLGLWSEAKKAPKRTAKKKAKAKAKAKAKRR
jgi:uncharacterized protein